MPWRSGFTILDRGGWTDTGYQSGYYDPFQASGFSLRNALTEFSVGRGSNIETNPLAFAPPAIFPSVVVQPPVLPAVLPDRQDIGFEPVVLEESVIDPEEAVSRTVFESATPDFTRFPIPRRVNDPIPVEDVNVEIYPSGSRPVAFSWGDFAGNVLGGIAGGMFDPVGLGSGVKGLLSSPSQPTYSGAPAQMPAKVTYDTRTGVVTPCRRRRRRRLLTSSDLADIAALKAIVGGGAALNAVVVKAVRR